MQSVSASSWIVVSDLHGSAKRLAHIPQASSVAGILIAGDLTVSEGITAVNRVLGEAAKVNPRILTLFGNMDRPEVAPWLDAQGIALHRTVRELNGDTVIMGVGGSPFTPMGTPSEFPESRIAEWLDEMWLHAREYRHIILISHTPPLDTACDRIYGGRHAGSSAVRDFIMERRPDICLCGHIHESRSVDKIGKTVIVNPGKLEDGGYAVLTLGEQPTVTPLLLP